MLAEAWYGDHGTPQRGLALTFSPIDHRYVRDRECMPVSAACLAVEGRCPVEELMRALVVVQVGMQ
jgi:hypothetical protein